MILRLVRQRRVSIVRGSPCIGRVAHITRYGRVEVARILTRRRHAVVTGRARPQHLGMVNGKNRREHIRGVAVFTHVRSLYVCRVLTGRVCAVMAAKAIARNIHVIEIRRQPRDSAVTVIAVVAAGNMVWRLA